MRRIIFRLRAALLAGLGLGVLVLAAAVDAPPPSDQGASRIDIATLHSEPGPKPEPEIGPALARLAALSPACAESAAAGCRAGLLPEREGLAP